MPALRRVNRAALIGQPKTVAEIVTCLSSLSTAYGRLTGGLRAPNDVQTTCPTGRDIAPPSTGRMLDWTDAEGQPLAGTTIWSVTGVPDQFAPSTAPFMINYLELWQPPAGQ